MRFYVSVTIILPVYYYLMYRMMDGANREEGKKELDTLRPVTLRAYFNM